MSRFIVTVPLALLMVSACTVKSDKLSGPAEMASDAVAMAVEAEGDAQISARREVSRAAVPAERDEPPPARLPGVSAADGRIIFAANPAPVRRSADAGSRQIRRVFGAEDAEAVPEQAVALVDDQIADMRGGFSGIGFSVFFSGHIDSLGQTEGQFIAGSNGVQVPQPVFGINDGQVNIQTHIGDFQGATGIFMISQVPGSFNIVNNNMFIQINLIHSAAAAQLAGF